MIPEEIAEIAARAQEQILKVNQQLKKVEASANVYFEHIDSLYNKIEVLHREAKSSNRVFLFMSAMCVFLLIMLIVQ